jgi:MFS family permease
MFGACFGGLVFGYYSFQHGRKSLFYATLSVYIISVFLGVLSVNIHLLYVARFLAGVGIGGEYTAIFAMIDEIVPSRVRGTINIYVSSVFHLGLAASALLGFAFSNKLSNVNDHNTWRVLFFFAILFVIPILYIRKYLPESPRWVLSKSKPSEAEIIVDLI